MENYFQELLAFKGNVFSKVVPATSLFQVTRDNFYNCRQTEELCKNRAVHVHVLPVLYVINTRT